MPLTGLEQRVNIKKIAFLGSSLPRQCGIATFTTDLHDALFQQFEGVDCFITAMTDADRSYEYDDRVRVEIHQNQLDDYLRAADQLNEADVSLVCLQHEFGIFGGPAGEMLLSFLHRLKMPVVTTLHTILESPTPEQKRVFQELVELSSRLIVMSRRGQEMMRDIYHAPSSKIHFIPHGIPTLPPVEEARNGLPYDLSGKRLLLTFGLLSPDKGIESAIKALPAILKKIPNATYLIAGATHPHVRARSGEQYRESLYELASKLGVQDHILFDNRFLELKDLLKLLSLAEIYVTPYLKPQQITSGTLAYAVGNGKAVVSTPYWYAQEMLAHDTDSLVPFKAPAALAKATLKLMLDDEHRTQVQADALEIGNDMVWPSVARKYMKVFEQAVALPNPHKLTVIDKSSMQEMPNYPIHLKHLLTMTDHTGMLQHATYSIPNLKEGYTLDDNARALILSLQLQELDFPEAGSLRTTYLAFIDYAFNRDHKRFRNFMSYGREWLEEVGSEESHGRALWALGELLHDCQDEEHCILASKLFKQAAPVVSGFTSPRAWAYAILGICKAFESVHLNDLDLTALLTTLSDKLIKAYDEFYRPQWPWFEPVLSYGNACLPHALLVAGDRLQNLAAIHKALIALNWLSGIQTSSAGYFEPVGCERAYRLGEEKPLFDQQPIEAGLTVSACFEAWRMTGESKWAQEAQKAFDWFVGKNHLGISVCKLKTGACHDGLERHCINLNQGAESTLAFLSALAEFRLTMQKKDFADLVYTS